MADLARLNPAFKQDGTVTEENSSGLNVGAAAILRTRKKAGELCLSPPARIVPYAAAGAEPHLMGYGPVPSTSKALIKAGMVLQDIVLIELAEDQLQKGGITQ
jgi:acetyl-CoA C-acetyltransferase